MSAVKQAQVYPVSEAATKYWEDLVRECQKQAQTINACALSHGLSGDELVEWLPGARIRMRRSRLPSTSIEAGLACQAWGPAISGTVTGYQDEETSFGHEEFELLLATDLDGSTIAIAGEGRSFTPEEVAKYLAQNFRRCFPCISLCDPIS